MWGERPRVVAAPPPAAVSTFLAADPLYGAYALGYLSPSWARVTAFTLAEDANGQAIALSVRHEERPQPFFIVFGERRGVLAILGDPTIAAWRRSLRRDGQEIWLAGQAEPLDACTGYFYPLERRILERHAAAVDACADAWNSGASGSQGGSTPRLLTPAEAPLLNVLYGLVADEPFAAEELARGAYYGVIAGAAGDERRCIAAAGTHVVAPSAAIAAIGNVYTAPAWRGRGYATACVAALCAHHAARGCRHIVLNVESTNAAALHVYGRLGFQMHCTYQEVRAVAL